MMHDTDQWMELLYLLAVLFLVAGGWRWQRLRHLSVAQVVKYSVLWLGVVLLLVLLHDYYIQP